MIDVKSAVKLAIDQVRQLYSETELSGFMLEEVELSPDEKEWRVTVGFDRKVAYRDGMVFYPAPATERVYKIVTIASDSGRLVSMKIRQTQEK